MRKDRNGSKSAVKTKNDGGLTHATFAHATDERFAKGLKKIAHATNERFAKGL